VRKIFGYCRVSSIDQNVERQIEAVSNFALEKYNVKLDEDDNLFIDKCSGKDFNRDEWMKLEMQLRQDDVLIIKELDRLGRNKEMITEVLQKLRKKKVRVHILDVPTTLIDFDSYGNDVANAMMEMINNLLVEVMATIAENERIKIRQRQAEGIALAKARGVYKGRKSVTVEDLPKEFPRLYVKWKRGYITAIEFTQLLGLKSKTTLYKYIKIYEGSLEKEVI
jgi:DNA invertase Pin-like site-specific DNA recombinase